MKGLYRRKGGDVWHFRCTLSDGRRVSSTTRETDKKVAAEVALAYVAEFARDAQPWKYFYHRLKPLAAVAVRHSDGICTYVFQDQFGLLKMGKTTSVTRRLKEISNTSGRELRCVLIVEGDCEALLQGVCAKWRTKGEWFEPMPSVIETVRRLSRVTRVTSEKAVAILNSMLHGV